jgi:hypothetical protein
MLTPELLQEAQIWCDTTTEMLRSSVTQNGLYSSGSLWKSITITPQVVDDEHIEIVLEMLDYGYYQDQGVQGADPSKMPNGKGVQKAPMSKFKFGTGKGTGSLFSSLDGWIVQKNIAPRDKKGKFMERAGVKYVIARSIYLQGLTPRMWFTPVWEKQMEGLTPLLERGLIKDIELQWFERIKSKHKN